MTLFGAGIPSEKPEVKKSAFRWGVKMLRSIK